MKLEKALIYAGQVENVGDLAILISAAALLRSEGISKVGVSQWMPPTDDLRQVLTREGIDVIPSKSLSGFLGAANALHVIGGGQLVRNNQMPRAIGLLLGRVKTTKLTGGRVIGMGLGVGEIETPRLKMLWKSIFAACDAVCVRDQGSFENVRALGGDPTLAGDLVFLLNGVFDRTVAERDLIVIAPCIDASEKRNLDMTHVSGLVAAAKAANPSVRIAFALHDEVRDGSAMKKVCDQAGLVADHIVATGKVNDFAALYARSMLTITNRLHSIIFSVRSAAPVVCLNNGGKIEAAVQELGLTSLVYDADAPSEGFPALINEARRRVDQAGVNAVQRASINLDVLRKNLAS